MGALAALACWAGPSDPAADDPYEIGAWDLAREAGLRIDSSEVVVRQRLLASLGGDTLPFQEVRRDLEADTYFASIAPISPSPDDMERQWDSLAVRLPPGVRIQRTEAWSYLQSLALAENPENRSALQERLDRRRQQRFDSLLDAELRVAEEGTPLETPPTIAVGEPRPQPLWPVRKIQLDASAAKCLARDTVAGACLVSVGEFNLQVLNFPAERSTPRDSVRAEVLDKALNEIHYAELGRGKGLDRKDGVRARTEEALAGLDESVRATGRSARLTDSVLQDLYRRRSEEARRRSREVRVTGCSDSSLCDSLYRAATPKRARGGKPVAAPAVLPGVVSVAVDLPAPLRAVADTLAPGAVSKPVRTRYGRFLLSGVSVAAAKDSGFEASRPELMAQALAERIRSHRMPDARAIEEHYRNHFEDFLAPDTLVLDAWLFPGDRQGIRKLSDTSRHRPLRVVSVDLPDSTRLVLERFRESMPDRESFGFSDFLGTWVFRVAQVRAGRGPSPLAQVRDRIENELASRPAGWMSVPERLGREMVQREVLALATWQTIQQAVPPPEPRRLDSALAARMGTAGKGASEAIREKVSRDLQEAVWRGELDAWKRRIAIDRPSLAR